MNELIDKLGNENRSRGNAMNFVSGSCILKARQMNIEVKQ